MNENGERGMKKFISLLVVCLITFPAIAVTDTSKARPSMVSQMVLSAPRATASTNQIAAMTNASVGAAVVDKSSIRVPVGTNDNVNDDEDQDSSDSDENEDAEYEKQKLACLSNNIGLGNTFVWASRYSNANNYSSMVEDINNPENNICFVLVEVKSSDSKIDVSDVPEKYFQMGQNIKCGSWADEEILRQRILDAKKGARTWATVGGVVGGAGVGVGVMELFGNRLIGGSVMGQKQKGLSDDEVLLRQLRALKNQDKSEFDDFISALETLKAECDGWQGDEKPEECSIYNYDNLLNAKN